MAGGDVRQRKGHKKQTAIHEDVDALKRTLADAVARRESRSGVSCMLLLTLYDQFVLSLLSCHNVQGGTSGW